MQALNKRCINLCTKTFNITTQKEVFLITPIIKLKRQILYLSNICLSLFTWSPSVRGSAECGSPPMEYHTWNAVCEPKTITFKTAFRNTSTRFWVHHLTLKIRYLFVLRFNYLTDNIIDSMLSKKCTPRKWVFSSFITLAVQFENQSLECGNS